MLELLVTFCFLDDQTRCRDVSLTYMSESVTPMQCMMGSPPEIAKYVEAHPKWFAKKWSCRPAGKFAKI
jgi:hypothetical protein